jgi:hypothetical protein
MQLTFSLQVLPDQRTFSYNYFGMHAPREREFDNLNHPNNSSFLKLTQASKLQLKH